MAARSAPLEMQEITLGNDPNPANNVKLHRGASGVQLVPGNDATADGADSGAASKLSSVGLSIPADPSFNVTIPSNNNVTITSGTLHLADSGTEVTLAANLSVSLLTGISLSGVATGGALGSPQATTTYYLYLDTAAIGALTTDAVTGRPVYTGVIGTSLIVLPIPPQQANLSRFVFLASLKTDGSGNYTAAGEATASYKSAFRPSANTNPRVYSLAKQAVGAVGSVGQVAAGHVLLTKSFPVNIGAAQYSFYNLASGPNDGTPNARNLTPNSAPPFTGTNVLGATNAAVLLNGTSQYFSSSSAFFNPGNGVNFSMGGWFSATSWVPGVNKVLLSNQSPGGADIGFFIELQTNGDIFFSGTNTGTANDAVLKVLTGGGLSAGFHHIVFLYSFSTSTLKAYIDGKFAGSTTLANQRAITTSNFQVGAVQGVETFAGTVEDVFFVSGYAMQDQDIRKLYAATLPHNKGVQPQYQLWSANEYTANGQCAQDSAGAEQTWLVDKSDPNSVWVDFSDLSATDSVEVFLDDKGFGANNIPVLRYDSGLLSALPTFPINHGLPDIPTEVVILYEVSANQFEQLPNQGNLQWTATQLIATTGSGLNLLTISGSNRIRIMAFVGASAAAISLISSTGFQAKSGAVAPGFSVPAGTNCLWLGDLDIPAGVNVDVQGTLLIEGAITGPGTLTGPGPVRNLNYVNANVLDTSGLVKGAAVQPAQTSQQGVVTIGRQSFSGIKIFTSGLGIAANIRAAESGVVALTDFDNRYQVCNASGTLQLKLPSTGVVAGEIFLIENISSVNDLLVEDASGGLLDPSNGTNMNARLTNGFVVVQALVSTPLVASQWRVVDYYSEGTATATWTMSGGGTSAVGVPTKFLRKGSKISAYIPCPVATTGTGTSAFTTPSNSMPVWAQPVSDLPAMFVPVQEANIPFTSPGLLRLRANGSFELFKNTQGAVWSNAAANSGFHNVGAGISLSYVIVEYFIY